MEEIESLVNWYENTHLSEKATKVFLSNGASFVYKVPKRQIAHLLGIKTDFLVNSRMLSQTSSYEVLKEFIISFLTLRKTDSFSSSLPFAIAGSVKPR